VETEGKEKRLEVEKVRKEKGREGGTSSIQHQRGGVRAARESLGSSRKAKPIQHEALEEKKAGGGYEEEKRTERLRRRSLKEKMKSSEEGRKMRNG